MAEPRSPRDERSSPRSDRVSWWRAFWRRIRSEPPPPPAPDPLAENPNPQLRPKIHLASFQQGRQVGARDRYDEWSPNVDRSGLVVAGSKEDDSRRCTSCGKSERLAAWMLTGFSALVCDTCVKRRLLWWRRP